MARSIVLRLCTGGALFAVAMAATAASPGLTRASDWLGHAVVTPDGLDVGTVRDLAIDTRTGELAYVVVSVGSFLIENNLIAVAPDALVAATSDDETLRLEADADSLMQAKRFAMDGTWPARADVQRSTTAASAPAAAREPTTPTTNDSPSSGTATITSATKIAHLSANERVITGTVAKAPANAAPPPLDLPEAAVAVKPGSDAGKPFDRLDKDKDGVLNRSEFAHEMSASDRFSRIDANANGVIEHAEFDAFVATRP